ncbi:hypothetical protein F5Y18DRAFT_399155 [Xylariaceae sp. FL1019]|nr:hypothetical protein F5Y18DRAFT_399155 [Xylariaceae sp. FL1019]
MGSAEQPGSSAWPRIALWLPLRLPFLALEPSSLRQSPALLDSRRHCIPYRSHQTATRFLRVLHTWRRRAQLVQLCRVLCLAAARQPPQKLQRATAGTAVRSRIQHQRVPTRVLETPSPRNDQGARWLLPGQSHLFAGASAQKTVHMYNTRLSNRRILSFRKPDHIVTDLLDLNTSRMTSAQCIARNTYPVFTRPVEHPSRLEHRTWGWLPGANSLTATLTTRSRLCYAIQCPVCLILRHPRF